ncbi:DUF3710 domain-containing protein [Enteractinococcus fodinae]|uniref:DUF3710 domain-containing protein n=1 Tax=Enteractinococcus fodinae TaxID=684663 RepID=A0ABU2B0Y6_9MICC|nr:DUF3710 domain-containing protein [Enteractinococcus fodinae]MDR7347265.1 hypothetical protein [Enteractinococcus fodinae]
MLFGRNRHVQAETVVLPEHLREDDDAPVGDTRPDGPFDITEVDTKDFSKGYMDLGAVKVPLRKNVSYRLEQEQANQKVFAVSAVHENSTLQIQAFAAPRSGGQWDEIRQEMFEQNRNAKGAKVTLEDGEFGKELLIRIPAKLPDGRQGERPARFLGIDGPRWMIRAMIMGKAALKKDEAVILYDILKDTVIDRGDRPLPARQMLELTPPENVLAAMREAAARRREQAKQQDANQ